MTSPPQFLSDVGERPKPGPRPSLTVGEDRDYYPHWSGLSYTQQPSPSTLPPVSDRAVRPNVSWRDMIQMRANGDMPGTELVDNVREAVAGPISSVPDINPATTPLDPPPHRPLTVAPPPPPAAPPIMNSNPLDGMTFADLMAMRDIPFNRGRQVEYGALPQASTPPPARFSDTAGGGTRFSDTAGGGTRSSASGRGSASVPASADIPRLVSSPASTPSRVSRGGSEVVGVDLDTPTGTRGSRG